MRGIKHIVERWWRGREQRLRHRRVDSGRERICMGWLIIGSQLAGITEQRLCDRGQQRISQALVWCCICC